MNKSLKEIQERIGVILADLESEEKRNSFSTEELEALKAEADELVEEKRQLNELIETREKEMRDALEHGVVIETPKKEERKMEFEKETVLDTAEYRSAWAKTLLGRELNDVEKRAYSTADTVGAEIIPTDISNEIIKKVYEYAPVLADLRLMRVPGNLAWAIVDNEDEAAVHTENAAITGASDTLKQINLTGYEIVKLVSASKSVRTMSISAFETFITESLAEAVARKIEKYVFTGTGSSQPTGLVKAGSGTDGAYVEDTDLVTIAAATAVAEADVLEWYGMVASHPGMKAYMSKATFMSYFYGLMNVGKNISIRFVNGEYFILDIPVVFTDTLGKGIGYLASLKKVVANLAQDIVVESNTSSGFTRNAVDFKADCLFDCKPITGQRAFAKFVKAQS